jgi:hypothetical protein
VLNVSLNNMEELYIKVTFHNELSPSNNNNYKKQLVRSYLEGKQALSSENIQFDV